MAHSDQRQLEGKKQNQSLETGCICPNFFFCFPSSARHRLLSLFSFFWNSRPGWAPGPPPGPPRGGAADWNPIDRAICPHHQPGRPETTKRGRPPARLWQCPSEITRVPDERPHLGSRPCLLVARGKLGRATFFFAGGHDAGLVCTKPGWVYAHVCSEERREAKKKMGRFQWRLPIRRPALNKSGEISLSLSCVCVCPCDVLQRVKWAASWPSSLGLGSPWEHGRTCPRDLSAVQCSVHHVRSGLPYNQSGGGGVVGGHPLHIVDAASPIRYMRFPSILACLLDSSGALR